MTEPGGEAASEAGPNVTEGGAHDFAAANRRAQTGNLAKEAEKLARQRKLFVRDRLGLLLDADSFVEDGLLANANAPSDDLPADGVVTGRGCVDGRPVCEWVFAEGPLHEEGEPGAGDPLAGAPGGSGPSGG